MFMKAGKSFFHYGSIYTFFATQRRVWLVFVINDSIMRCISNIAENVGNVVTAVGNIKYVGPQLMLFSNSWNAHERPYK